jgi:anti-sigma factor RsiW
MDRPPCHDLDKYLSEALSEAERVAFMAHLEGCPGCRQVMEAQERMDRLLARAVVELTPVPRTLVHRIEAQVRADRRRRRARWAYGLVAAAAAALVVGVWLFPRSQPQETALPVPEPAPPVVAAPPQTQDPRSLVQVTFAPGSEVIAVPLRTTNPDVSIIWVYPTEKTATQQGEGPLHPSWQTGESGL